MRRRPGSSTLLLAVSESGLLGWAVLSWTMVPGADREVLKMISAMEDVETNGFYHLSRHLAVVVFSPLHPLSLQLDLLRGECDQSLSAVGAGRSGALGQGLNLI